jgi:elongation factor G
VIEALADVDDDIALAYLDGEQLGREQLAQALRAATCASRAVPVLCGSALRNLGVQPLLDAIVAYLPSPLDLPAIKGQDPITDEQIECLPDAHEPLATLVFKISTDPYMGKLAFFRVYSGVLSRGMAVLNPTSGDTARIGRLVRMPADRREEIEEIRAGDIGAVLGLKSAQTGQTLCDPSRPVELEQIAFPTPPFQLLLLWPDEDVGGAEAIERCSR